MFCKIISGSLKKVRAYRSFLHLSKCRNHSFSISIPSVKLVAEDRNRGMMRVSEQLGIIVWYRLMGQVLPSLHNTVILEIFVIKIFVVGCIDENFTTANLISILKFHGRLIPISCFAK